MISGSGFSHLHALGVGHVKSNEEVFPNTDDVVTVASKGVGYKDQLLAPLAQALNLYVGKNGTMLDTHDFGWRCLYCCTRAESCDRQGQEPSMSVRK